MARILHSWVSAILLFLLFQIGLALVFEEIPAPDVVPSTLRTRNSEDFDSSLFDLHGRESFYWGGSQNGHLALANLTIDLPGDDETVVSLETFKHLLSYFQCTNRTMTLGLENENAYSHVKSTWQWLNDVDPHKLVVVAGAGECGWNSARIPFSASTVVFDDAANTAKLVGRTISWKDFQNYELTVGNYRPVPTSGLAQRDIDKSLTLPFSFPLPFPAGQLNTPVDKLALTWFCADCGVEGSFDFGFHIETKLGVPKGASISLSPNGVAATLTPRLAVQADLTGDLDNEWEIGNIPIGGITIPGGILEIGPQITFSLGYSVGPLQGSAGINAGVTVTIPDNSELEIELIDPDIASSGWTPEVETKPFTVDARLYGEALLYVKAAVELSAEALGQGFEVGVNLQPYVGGAMMGQATSGEVCPNEGDHFGVKVIPRVGVALNAAVAKASDPEDPLAEVVVASITAPIPMYCTAWGGDGDSSSTSAPSSSVPLPGTTSKTTVATTKSSTMTTRTLTSSPPTSSPTSTLSPSSPSTTPTPLSHPVQREVYATRVL